MKSFLVIFIEVVLFFILMNQGIEAVYVEKNCGPNDSNCQQSPSNETQTEGTLRNVTCDNIEEWFRSNNNQKWPIDVWEYQLSTATTPGTGGIIAHTGNLGQVKDQLTLPAYWFNEAIKQTTATWDGKNFAIEWDTYPQISININTKVVLIYDHKLITKYDQETRQTILNIVENKDDSVFHLGLPSKCVTNFDPEKFEKQSNSAVNQEEPNWNNENDAPEKETKKAPLKKRGRKNKPKKEIKVTHHCVGSKC